MATHPKDREEWFIEPKGDAINESIAEEIAAEAGGDATCHKLLCADSKKHNLYRCDAGLVLQLMHSRKYKAGRDFEVWKKSSRGAKIENITRFLKSRRQRLPRKGSHMVRPCA